MKLNALPIKFAGDQATALARRQVRLSEAELKAALSEEPLDPYLGESPEQLQKSLRMTDQQTKQWLDKLATIIEDIPFRVHGFNVVGRIWLAFRMRFNDLKVPGANISVKFLGRGQQAKSCLIQVKGKPYKLKVFRDRREKFTDHGAYYESAMGLFLTANPTRNVAKTYCANPSKKWMLMEYIASSSQISQREGKLLRERGLIAADTASDNPNDNAVNGIIYDLGGIR